VNRAGFFEKLRGGFTGRIEPGEVVGTEAILDALAGLPLAYAAYALATAFHETAGTMCPIEEHGGVGYFTARYDINGARPDIAQRLGNTYPGDGARYRGRGYVQLTGRNNYRKAAFHVDADLEGHPELALRPDAAAKIMRDGMAEGWFTGKAFRSYLPPIGTATREQFRQARRIINGLDRAEDIAAYALGYQQALLVGEWA
jgi:putative chitinase